MTKVRLLLYKSKTSCFMFQSLVSVVDYSEFVEKVDILVGLFNSMLYSNQNR